MLAATEKPRDAKETSYLGRPWVGPGLGHAPDPDMRRTDRCAIFTSACANWPYGSARQLFPFPGTVHADAEYILRKTGARYRAEAFTLAACGRLLHPTASETVAWFV